MRWCDAVSAGFDGERLQQAFSVLASRADSEAIPCAVAAVGRTGTAVGPVAFGSAVRKPEPPVPAAPSTVFDLASLTKVVGTATCCWALIERGLARLQDRVADFLPRFAQRRPGEADDWRSTMLIGHLLTHTAGLPAHRDLRAVAGGREERLAAVERTALHAAPGARAVYSDLGFMLLGRVLEVAGGAALPDLCRAWVFDPLGMSDTGWLPDGVRAGRAAATEWSDGDAERPAGYLRGVVHDENARALGGVAGHAGLFSTASDLAVFAESLLAASRGLHTRPRVLSPTAVARRSAPVAVGPGDSRTNGWQGMGSRWSPFGDLWSPKAFGHTGFTGTSLWIDPVADVWIVLLTNAVHMGRSVGLPAMPRLRAYFHNAVLGAVDA